ncbi:SPOR domain-containing protein [Zavarzinia sp.]|uniref:SPOR domain-containing protein n=1 Tax=Zavarzinia sp. TaxID=2027920 RepID=UPI0035686D3B
MQGSSPQDPYSPDPYGQGPYRPGPPGERLVPPSTEEEGGGLKIGRLLLLGLAGGALLYFGLSLLAGSDHQTVTDASSVPLVRADNAPTKVPPEEPGGMEVPDQDKLIFDRIGGGTGDSSLPEQLLPPPDTPMARPTAPPPAPPPSAEAPAVPAPAPATAAPATPPAATPAPGTTAMTTPAPAPAAPPAAPAKPAATPATPAPAKPAPAPAAPAPSKPAATPTPAPAPAAPSAGGVTIQLAALKDEASAKQAWARLVKNNSDLLAGLKPIILPVQVNGATLYRLRAGPFATKDAAGQVCAKLKLRNQDCNVVR